MMILLVLLQAACCGFPTNTFTLEKPSHAVKLTEMKPIDRQVKTPEHRSWLSIYLDGSTTSGYYVSDQMHLGAVSVNSTSSNASASIVFGCSMNQTGYLTGSARAGCLSSVHKARLSFPNFNRTIDGGASLVLTPQDYLIWELGDYDSTKWCLGLQEGNEVKALPF